MQLFRTHYDSAVSSPHLSPEALIVYAVSAGQQLGWSFKFLSPSGVVMQPQGSVAAARHEVLVRKTKRGYVVMAANPDNTLRDWGIAEKLVRAIKDTLVNQISLLTQEEIEYRYEIILPHLQTHDDILEEERYEREHPKEGWWSFAKPVRGYRATPIILMLNALLFVLMVANGASPVEPSARTVFEWGGNWGTATVNGDWWRLVSAAFIHIGFLHLAMNMAALVYVGAFLEPLIGTRRFIFSYFLTAVGGGLLSTYVHPDTVSAGASGAIFGMFGVMLSLLTTRLIPADIRKRLLLLMGFYVVYNLLYGMKDGIDNAGHIGGLLSGFALGFLFYPALKKTRRLSDN